MNSNACHDTRRFDWLLWGSLGVVAAAYALHLLVTPSAQLATFTGSVYELMNRMWWGLALGIFFVGVLSKVPREFVMGVIGRAGSFNGICRATLAGLMLDLCSHGILLVGMKLYERGASLGQVMAFLIASPWNSISLTVILIALVGWQWTLMFIVGSLVIALISGVIFDQLVRRQVLPANPNARDMPAGFHFWRDAKTRLKQARYNRPLLRDMVRNGLHESRMILRWILFGVVLAAAIRTFMDPQIFASYFGPSVVGLGITLAVATILEVCSEGSAPIAADILNRAHAPGNAFTFLMAGVATDYTEILSLRETTHSWKIALFLPLVTIPQVLVIAWAVNQMG